MGYVYIFLTIFFTVYGQLVLKWRMSLKGQMPVGLKEKFIFMTHAYLDPWIVSGFLVAFFASVTWAMAMTKFELSKAYPFMSLSYVFVFILSVFLFKEQINTLKLIGFLLILSGVFVVSKSA
jgi:multidrug transporter EmrE-like cation transporter